MALGERLKDLRIGLGLSVREAANRIHKSPGYVSRIETRGEIPSPDLLITIAIEYDADLVELLKLSKQDYMQRVEDDIDTKQAAALSIFRREKR